MVVVLLVIVFVMTIPVLSKVAEETAVRRMRRMAVGARGAVGPRSAGDRVAGTAGATALGSGIGDGRGGRGVVVVMKGVVEEPPEVVKRTGVVGPGLLTTRNRPLASGSRAGRIDRLQAAVVACVPRLDETGLLKDELRRGRSGPRGGGAAVRFGEHARGDGRRDRSRCDTWCGRSALRSTGMGRIAWPLFPVLSEILADDALMAGFGGRQGGGSAEAGFRMREGWRPLQMGRSRRRRPRSPFLLRPYALVLIRIPSFRRVLDLGRLR